MSVFSTKRFDKVLLGLIIVLFAVGLLLIYSASRSTALGSKRLIIQTTAFGLSLLFMYFSTAIDYSVLKRYDWHLYILSILLLLLVYVPGLGSDQMGARSWIDLKVMYFQTSEAAKVTFTLAYASFLDRRKDKLNTLEEIIPAFLYPLPILFLLYKQPDLGGILVFASIILFCLFMAGLNKKWIIGGVMAVALIAPIVYKFELLEPHQMLRIEAFLNPGDPSYTGNYQLIASMTAIGSGKIFGKGLFNGTLIPFGFLPVPESDFIFSILGEEFGMVGMGAVIILFYILLSRIYNIAINSKDTYGNLIVMGFLGMFLYQIFQNIGMTVGLIPITGVTLPFLSYGGSSILMSMVVISIIMNVYSKSHSGFSYQK